MTRTQWIVISLVVAATLAVGVLIGRGTLGDTPQAVAPAEPAPRRILYYRNPMGLADTSPVPKKDAMGMDYLPVYAGEEVPTAPGTVVLTPEKVQKLGVRTEQVRLRPLERSIAASGTVTVDETRQHVIAPRFEGWVERLHADQTGMPVRRGQPLLTVYSPELLAAQEEYRVADAAARRLAGGDATSAASMARLRDAARARLRNWQISDAQLEHIGHKRSGNLVLTSPANAVVVEKPIVQGARFGAGETILRLADLSTVWVVANVPASQSGNVAVGQQASFQSPSLPNERFTGRVTFVQPIIDTATRTLGVRVALPNPDGVLRPGLFGDVTLAQAEGPAVLTAPRSAVIDSGTRQIVLVEVGKGRFEPRPVVVGRRAGDTVELIEGVAEGERVVVSANFLIDAESNLQSALQGLGAHPGRDGDTNKQAPASGGDKALPPADDAPAPLAPVPDPHAGHDMSGMEH